MLKKILLVVGVLVVGLVALIASRPAEFVIERTGMINAAPEHAFAQVNDFHKWAGWSPWAKMDPNQKETFGGAASGVGATYAWAGNDQVGEGRMEIQESKPNELLKLKLEFIKPFPATNSVSFSFSKEGEGTKVSWKMEGTNNFMSKAFCLVVDMDKMVGADFEKGLAAMKTLAEAAHTAAVATAKADAEAQAKAEADKNAADSAAATAPAP